MQKNKNKKDGNLKQPKSNPKLDTKGKVKAKQREHRAHAGEFIRGPRRSNKSGQNKGFKAQSNKTGSQGSTNKRRGVQKQQRKSTSQQIFSAVTTYWDLKNIRPKNDDFIIDCISGKRTTDISYWPALMIQQARTAACIGTKIKSSQPLQSDFDTVNEFIATQDIPVCSDRYSALLANKIDEVFKSFPYEAVKADVERQDRKHIITNGSSNPPLLAPIISGENGNVELIAAMAAGRKIFLSDFHVESWTTGIADGKVTTVPKNYKKSRVITITSRDFIDKQYVVSDALRDWITSWSRNSNHIIQFDDQTIQHKFLVEGNATLDLSSASDRIYRSLIEKVWPDFMKYFGEYLPKTVITDQGRIVPLTCIGTQGFPLTFTVMAIITGLIVSSSKMSSSASANYGDDIVISEMDFNEVYCALEALGLKINKSKTHKSSDGFLESCGRDVMFTKNGPRDVTPIHLRGESDVEVVQFFYQLCAAGLIDIEGAISILDKLQVVYYAFDYDYQLTEFHFPFGHPKNVPNPKWSYDRSQYICEVPALLQEVATIKGLSKTDSDVVLELLHIEAGLKNPNNSKKYVRGVDPVARPYAIMDLQDSRLYSLYQKLDVTGYQVLKIFYEEIEKEYKVSFKSLVYYKFITSELANYRFSTATVDFNNHKPVEYSLQELIDTEFGVKSDTKYPIYRYKVTKGTKIITHPNSNKKLGIE